MSQSYKNQSLRTRIVVNVFMIVCVFTAAIVTYQNYAVHKLISVQSGVSLERQNHSLITVVKKYMQESDYKVRSLGYIAKKEWEDGNYILNSLLQHLDDISHVVVMPKKNQYLMLAKFSKRNDGKYFGLDIPLAATFATSYITLSPSGNIQEKLVHWFDSEYKIIKKEKLDESAVSVYLEKIKKEKSLLKENNTKVFKPSDVSGLPVLFNIGVLDSNQINDKKSNSADEFDLNSGLIVAEISLASMSVFMDSGRPTENARFFLLDSKNQILADSSIPKNDHILTVDTLETSILKIGCDRINLENSADTSANILFDTNNKTYRILFNKFPPASHLDWKMVSLSPLDDYVKDSDKIRFYSILISSLILLLILLWLYFKMSTYSQTLGHIKVESKKIRDFDLHDSVLIESDVSEMNGITSEIQSMKMNFKNFSRFIPRSLVQKFISSGQDVEIGGKEVPVTLFFSDIKGFTTISEKTPANLLFIQLSEYLEELTTVITNKNGTIDKYIGDAIMAFWGAPDEDALQEENAAISALMCQKRLIGLNKFWHYNGQFEFVTRIGLHSGTAIVGNVGSSDRMNYTAIGDTVNLAARLEGANKFYDTNILMSEAVKNKLKSSFIYRPVDIVAVKGKDLGVPIFELIGMQDHEYMHPVPQNHVDYYAEFSQMYALYLKREFKAASDKITELREMSKNCGIEDYLLDIYQERIDEFLKVAPDDSWVGVFHMNSK
ncbi:MAG: adenylate/guanylate cyclase domain-containing protein [Candidatus Paracaedibacteraceae bacterium]|nr:adenylate/guanylate cyclase domain-containing protein [Candidatus Paracaedibacteraceae bacterium]